MTFAEQLNALFRLSIYFSIFVFIIKHDINIFFVAIFMGLLTFILFSLDIKNKENEQFFLDANNLSKDRTTGNTCVKPTKDNPFMNVLMTDIINNPTRPKACSLSNSNVKQEATSYFNKGLYRDVGDVFTNMASDRQYYTNPSTTIPNDRETFGKWLYQNGPTCK